MDAQGLIAAVLGRERERDAPRALTVVAGVSLVATVGKVLLRWWRTRSMLRKLSSVPYSRSKRSAIFGFIPDFLRNFHRMHDWRYENTDGLPISKYSGFFFDPAAVGVIVRDPLLLRHILKDNFNNYTKKHPRHDLFTHYFEMWLGDGIFNALHGPGADDNGEGWAKQRKIASTIFSRGNFNNNMQVVFAAKAARLRELLARPAAAGDRVDMQFLFFGYTMDSIMDIFFGEKADTMAGAENTYATAFDTAHRYFFKHVFEHISFLSITQSLPWPVGGIGGLLWRLMDVCSGTYWTYRGAIRTLDRESSRVIAACRADPQLPERRDLLALFLAAEGKDRFSARFLRDVVANFVIAGRDTTACTLSWMFLLLARHPEIQEKLCREIDEKFPDKEVPTLKSLAPSEMPYLQGVLYEALRLYPPVPFDIKVATADDVLPNGSCIPAGAEVVFAPYAMGRDKRIYEDPEVVRPERWIPFVAPPPHQFPVFQAGPRICLGMDMAVFEAKLLASTLLQEYTFELAPGEDEKITYMTTLTMSICNSKKQDSHNLWLIPRKRR